MGWRCFARTRASGRSAPAILAQHVLESVQSRLSVYTRNLSNSQGNFEIGFTVECDSKSLLLCCLPACLPCVFQQTMSKCCSAKKCPFGPVQTVVNLSAVACWATIAASIVYKAQGFPTPFGDSLTDEQKEIKKQSAKARSKVYGQAFGASAVVLLAASAKFLRWN